MAEELNLPESFEPTPPATVVVRRHRAANEAPEGKAAADLAAKIACQVERESSDRVSCRHVYGNYYRCNWWARESTSRDDNPGMGGLTATTHRVRKSAFLRVVKSDDGLAIQEMDGGAAHGAGH